jgi:hypothetical protein
LEAAFGIDIHGVFRRFANVELGLDLLRCLHVVERLCRSCSGCAGDAAQWSWGSEGQDDDDERLTRVKLLEKPLKLIALQSCTQRQSRRYKSIADPTHSWQEKPRATGVSEEVDGGLRPLAKSSRPSNYVNERSTGDDVGWLCGVDDEARVDVILRAVARPQFPYFSLQLILRKCYVLAYGSPLALTDGERQASYIA